MLLIVVVKVRLRVRFRSRGRGEITRWPSWCQGRHSDKVSGYGVGGGDRVQASCALEKANWVHRGGMEMPGGCMEGKLWVLGGFVHGGSVTWR